MERGDDRLKRGLAEGPLKRDGFDERLRRRIEERLDEQPARRRSFTFRFAGAGAGALAILAVILIVASLHPLEDRGAGRTAGNPEADRPIEAPADPLAAVEEENPGRSVLLLGLRQDRTAGGPSAYRTLLVSAGPDAADWSLTEGEGIVLPYRIDFWRLAMTETAAGGGTFRLVGAYNTAYEGAAPQPIAGRSAAGAAAVEERILFAGNRYIALSRRVDGQEMHRVMDILDLGRPRYADLAAAGVERHVLPGLQPDGTLGVVASDEPGAEGAAEWTVDRKAGRWVALAAAGGAGGAAAGRLQELPYKVGSSIVAHNELAVSWASVRDVLPAAVDAFTSPSRDAAVIVTDRQIAVYEMKGGELGGEMLEAALREGETVIMAEWATNEAYIDTWLEKVGALLRE